MGTTGKADGRQARSRRTRAAVAEAMLDRLEAGVLRPSAREVAERAGVSTRAVFRHFDNMEALFEEAAQIQIERVMGRLPTIVVDGTLDARIDSLLAYITLLHEIVAPVRRASLLSEPFSDVIREKLAWMRAVIRRRVRASFAPELDLLGEPERSDRIAAIAALLSFAYWEELRRRARLSKPAATRVLRGVLDTLIRA